LILNQFNNLKETINNFIIKDNPNGIFNPGKTDIAIFLSGQFGTNGEE